MKFLTKRTDGGPESNVTGYWLIEWKAVFSIALLRFSKGSRENFHNHAFHAVSWFLSGSAKEEKKLTNGDVVWRDFKPSFIPVITTRQNLHRVHGQDKTTWALTFRGPWNNTWNEYNEKEDKLITLTHSRKIV